MMKFVVVATVGLCSSVTVYGQNYFAYENPIEKQVYSLDLKDTVKYELILPKAALVSHGIQYPVIVVFDRQNRFSYANTINTIDYLTMSMAIPNSIILGISLDERQRNRWTRPKHRKGMAESFMNFIVDDPLFPGQCLP